MDEQVANPQQSPYHLAAAASMSQGSDIQPLKLQLCSVASLGWVTPGAATEGVTPLFFPEKPGDLFLLIAVTITIAFHCFHSGVTSLEGVTLHLFYLSHLVSPLFFVNLPINFFLRVSPPGGCHPGRSAPRTTLC